MSQQQPPAAHAHTFEMWRNDFMEQQRDLFDGPSSSSQQPMPPPQLQHMAQHHPGPSTDQVNWTREFFNETQVRQVTLLFIMSLTIKSLSLSRTFPSPPKVFSGIFRPPPKHSATVNSPSLSATSPTSR